MRKAIGAVILLMIGAIATTYWVPAIHDGACQVAPALMLGRCDVASPSITAPAPDIASSLKPAAATSDPTATPAAPNPTPQPTPTPQPAPTTVPAPVAVPTQQPTPTPGPTPVSGSVDLSGSVATEFPGTLIAAGANVTSVLDCVTRTRQLFGIDLLAGQTLQLAFDPSDQFGWSVDILLPGLDDPQTQPGDADWIPVFQWGTPRGFWTVATSGRYTLGASCFNNAPFRYHLSVAVT